MCTAKQLARLCWCFENPADCFLLLVAAGALSSTSAIPTQAQQ
jgi:hypothetical protein